MVTVGDRNGMMVSLIQSNFANMGSGLVVPSLGLHKFNFECCHIIVLLNPEFMRCSPKLTLICLEYRFWRYL